MDETAIIDKLMQFGLTRQEAVIYGCVFRNGELTGYEVAKQTGISRSNVYGGLAGLTEKGAAYLVEGGTNKYVAVPVREFCQNKIRSLSIEEKYLEKHMPCVKEFSEGYITIKGYKNIFNKIINMIRQADQRIYIASSSTFIDQLEPDLMIALHNKIKLVLMPDQDLKNKELKNGSICYIGSAREGQIRLIIDSCYALTGEITGNDEDTCLYTGQKNFIDVFKEALRNEIKLIQITKDTGPADGRME